MAMFRFALAAALFAFLPVQAAQDDPRLGELFDALAKAPSAELAAPIEGEIWKVWAESKSPTTELLAQRGAVLLAAGDADTALELVEAVTALNPDYAEGWHMLANLQMMREETTEAIIAIKRTLALEPRHFGALAVLGTVMESLGDDKAALAAFDASLKLNPNQDDVKQQASTLRRKLDGDRI